MANVYYHLNSTVNFVGSLNPSDCVGEFAFGGGIGFLTSWYGFSAHYLEEVELINANGTSMTIKDENHPDIMKVIRGGNLLNFY